MMKIKSQSKWNGVVFWKQALAILRTEIGTFRSAFWDLQVRVHFEDIIE